MQKFTDKLLNRKKEIIKIIEDLNNEFRDISSCDIKEESDFASCSANSENNIILLKKLEQELVEINEALESIKNGSYGICQMCEEEINPERLEIKPFAKYCIDCREIIEKENRVV